MKRVILVICAALAVFAGILIVVPNFIDWNKHRADIVAQLSNATGHYYEIGGGLSLAILPFPHVEVEKLLIAPAKDAEPLATVERADVSVALMPLFQGKVNVSSVALVHPDIRLSIAADGTPSWTTPVLKEKLAKKQPEEGGRNVAESVALNDVRIKGGAFRFADHRSGKIYELKEADLNVHGDTLRGPFDADGALVYNGQKVEFDAKTGKMAAGSDSLALQLSAKMPQSSTDLSWSGVVSTKGAFEAQGETALKTADAGALAMLAGGAAPPALAGKALDLRGLMTVSPEAAALRNMKVSYGGASGSGDFAAENIGKGQTPVITLSLAMDGPVDAGAFLPPPAQGGKKTDKRFLPETVTLPRALAAKVSFSAPAVTYQDKRAGDVKLGFSYKDKALDYEASATMPGGAAGSESGRLIFAGMSTAAQTGAVTLSDPSLSYNFEFKADKIEETLKPFMAQPPVTGKVAAKGKGSLSQKTISFEDTSVSFMGVPARVDAAYTVGARDRAKLSVAASGLDLDKLMPAPAQTQQKQELRDITAKIALPFDLDLNWALENVKLKGRDYNRLAGNAVLTGKTLKIAGLEMKDARGNTGGASGTVGDIAALKDIDMTVQGSTPDAPALISEFTGKPAKLPPGVKSGEVVAALKGQPEALGFTANIKAMNGTADVSGTLANVLKTPEVGALTLRLKHPNYTELARLFMPEFSSDVGIRKSLDIFMSMKRDGAVYKFSEVQATIGPSQMTGAVTADLSGAKPSVTANVQAGDLPVDQLLGHDVRQKGESAAKQGPRWSREPLNFQWMHNFNFAVNGTARSFSYGPWDMKNATFDVALKDGALSVAKIEGDMNGGRAALSGKAVSASAASPLNVDGKASLQDVSLESFVQSFAGSKLVQAKGTVSVNADVATAGANAAALVGGLGGSGGAKGHDLVFEGFDLARLSRALVQPPGSLKEGLGSLLDASMKGGSTRFDTLDSSFTIANGIVNIGGLTLTGPDATVTSPGIVNLPLWTIDMTSTIQLAEPKDAPPLKAVFKGSLDNPGQTFAKGAMDNYVRNLVGSKVQDAIINKLQDKKALEGQGGDILRGIVGGLTGQPVAPAQPPQQQQTVPATEQPAAGQETAPVPEAAPAAAPEPAPAPAQQPAQQKEITLEDVFQGVLEGVLQGR